MFNRALQGQLPKKSFFLFGPRQVGKSTLLGHLQTIFAVDLLDPEKQLLYTKQPNLLAQQLEASPHEGWVLVDEIQRVPKLLDVIHSLMEKYPKLNFALSGSSARKVRHGAANLLGGRALYRTLHPLTTEELGTQFRLDRALSYGTLPKIFTHLLQNEEELAKDFLRTYVVTYLREEIKAEALVRNLQNFQNFLDIAAAQFSEQVNLSDMGRECHVAYATVREFYTILEDTLMGFFLRPCLESTRKRMSHAPKFYFFDNGVTRSILGTLQSPPSLTEKGRLFEQWFVQEVYRLNAYQQKDWKFSFWRTSHGAEVDLILERGREIVCAIEIKYKQGISNADLSGIYSFSEVFPKKPCYLVAPVEKPIKVNKVTIYPPSHMIEILKNL